MGESAFFEMFSQVSFNLRQRPLSVDLSEDLAKPSSGGEQLLLGISLQRGGGGLI